MSRADDNLAAMRADTDSDWAGRLAVDIRLAPLMTEQEIESYLSTRTKAALTSRELEALMMAAHGNGMKESAVKMGTTYDAVFSLLRQSRRKLQARDTTHAVALAIWGELL